jgi:hypothetical protein
MALGLRKKSRINSFTHFSPPSYSFDIWYIALPYRDTEFGSDPLIFHEVMALGLRKISPMISFPDFFFSAYRYSFNIWYIVLLY